MTQNQIFSIPPINPIVLAKRMLLGAAIGLILISIFVLPIRNPDPSWGRFWIIRPMIVTPIAGAMAGLVFYYLNLISYEGGWKKLVAVIFGILVYFIALWLGTVLGLAGTLWN